MQIDPSRVQLTQETVERWQWQTLQWQAQMAELGISTRQIDESWSVENGQLQCVIVTPCKRFSLVLTADRDDWIDTQNN